MFNKKHRYNKNNNLNIQDFISKINYNDLSLKDAKIKLYFNIKVYNKNQLYDFIKQRNEIKNMFKWIFKDVKCKIEKDISSKQFWIKETYYFDNLSQDIIKNIKKYSKPRKQMPFSLFLITSLIIPTISVFLTYNQFKSLIVINILCEWLLIFLFSLFIMYALYLIMNNYLKEKFSYFEIHDEYRFIYELKIKKDNFEKLKELLYDNKYDYSVSINDIDCQLIYNKDEDKIYAILYCYNFDNLNNIEKVLNEIQSNIDVINFLDKIKCQA